MLNLIKLNWGEKPLQEGKVSSLSCCMLHTAPAPPTNVHRPKAREARTDSLPQTEFKDDASCRCQGGREIIGRTILRLNSRIRAMQFPQLMFSPRATSTERCSCLAKRRSEAHSMGMSPRHRVVVTELGCGQGEEGEQVRRRLLATLSRVPGREREAPQLGVTLNHLLSSFPAHEWRLRRCPAQPKPWLCFPRPQNEVVTVSLLSRLSVAHQYSQPREKNT